jgi:hypothetical protein
MTRIERVGNAACAKADVLAASNASPAAKQLIALFMKPLPGARLWISAA